MAILLVGGLLVWTVVEAANRYDREYRENRRADSARN